MGKKKSEEIVLTYENQDYTESNKYAYYPIYVDCYEKCIRNIFTDLIRREDEKENCSDKFGYVCRDNASSIEAFLGARGTGKSTAMVEFCNILEQLNNRETREWWLEQSIKDNAILDRVKSREFKFKVINIVDAGNLEDKEDLFELVLSAIFKDYQKQIRDSAVSFEKYGHEDRDIIQLFSHIMEGYYSIKNSKREEFGDSYVSRLKSMSSSVDIRNEIKRLITKIFNKAFGKTENCFLVIAIDDLDINVSHGYEMLEQLHKYFFLPNVIILLSADYTQLEYVCKYHYIRSFVHDTAQKADDIVIQSDKLAKDYITKVLPIDKRVHMPKFFSENRNIIVNRDYNFKTYIISKVAAKLNILYDLKGMKRHFIEVKNVRELVSYSHFIDSLLDTNNINDVKQCLLMYDQNVEQFKADFETRIVGKILSSDQKDIYDDIVDKRIEKQIVSIHELMYNEIKKVDGLKEPWAQRIVDYSVDAYGYGDLISEIYEFGRLKKENKGLVKCFLGAITAEMHIERSHYWKTEDDKSKERAKRNLDKLLGNSVCNKWLGEMLPKLKQPSDSIIEASGVNMPSVSWGIINNVTGNMVNLYFKRMNELAKDIKIEDVCKRVLDYIVGNEVIQSIECMSMFLKPKEDYNEWVEWKLYIDKDERCLTAGVKNEQVEFDMLGFVKKSVNWEYNVKKLHEQLERAIGELVHEIFYSQIDRFIDEQIKNIVAENSILNNEWIKSDISAFPFYNLDLSYNVLKRARRNLKEKNAQEIDSEHCFDYLKRVYLEIDSELDSEDRSFKDIGIESSLSNNFREFPFIKAFMSNNIVGNDFKSEFGKVLCRMTYNTTFGPIDMPEYE